uniref:Uncharacterized protein n=1 Tax=Chenopodium quinoa TaxID=63459 RepID=A0A803L4W2_CHEQI
MPKKYQHQPGTSEIQVREKLEQCCLRDASVVLMFLKQNCSDFFEMQDVSLICLLGGPWTHRGMLRCWPHPWSPDCICRIAVKCRGFS